MAKYERIRSYKTSRGGRTYKVKSYTRTKRKIGRKIKYIKTGYFYIAKDEYGNLRGSRIAHLKH